MRLYAFHCGGEMVPMSVISPFAENPGEMIEIPYFFYLVQHEQGNVLFDSGTHPSLADRPEERLGPVAELIEIKMEPTDGVVDHLAKVGLSPDDIDLVIQSHLHYDHAGGLEFFPDSLPVMVQEEEFNFAFDPPVYQKDMYVAADFDKVINWKKISGEEDVFGDGKIVAFPTPGHSRGHQSLLVRLEEQPVILVADAAYARESIDEQILPGVLWSPDAMVDSWQHIRRLRDETGAHLIVTHDREYPVNTKLAPDGWYE